MHKLETETKFQKNHDVTRSSDHILEFYRLRTLTGVTLMVLLTHFRETNFQFSSPIQRRLTKHLTPIFAHFRGVSIFVQFAPTSETETKFLQNFKQIEKTNTCTLVSPSPTIDANDFRFLEKSLPMAKSGIRVASDEIVLARIR